MHRIREIRKSLNDYIKGLFESPPAASGLNAYNVYTENQLRRVRTANFSPTDPFVFIVDSYIEPTKAVLPLIVLDTSYLSGPYEMGNKKGRFCRTDIHVYGKNRGERDDLAGIIQDALAGNPDLGASPAFPIYTYSSGSATQVEMAHIEEGIVLIPISVGEDLAHEGSLNNWNVVTFQFRTKS